MKIEVRLSYGCGELEHIAAVFYCDNTQQWLYLSFGDSGEGESSSLPYSDETLLLAAPNKELSDLISWAKNSQYARPQNYAPCGNNCVTAVFDALRFCGIDISYPRFSCHLYSCLCVFFPVPMMTPKALFKLLKPQQLTGKVTLPELLDDKRMKYKIVKETKTSALLAHRYR